MTQSQDHRFSRTANTAGAPLPIIPRRTSSGGSRHSLSTSSYPLPYQGPLSASSSASNYPSAVTITPATPPKNEDESSSNSDASRSSRRKRKSGSRNVNPNALYPPELSTPIPSQAATQIIPTQSSQKGNAAESTPLAAPRPMMYVPGMPLRLSLESLKFRSLPANSKRPAISTSVSLPVSASTSSITSPTESPLIRKKSGQVVRSSLKSSRSSSRCQDGLEVLNPAFPSSKSEPATPTASKAVHFDANLEQVKLFLAEQKPLAVSRDGSPTDDTSGTDSDFPWFIYGHGESGSKTGSGAEVNGGDEKKSKLVMHSNMPPRTAPFYPSTDVSLEDLTLSADAANIQGHVIVRNIAFNKSVAVRFTFDKWQTTSEVLAKWQESVGREKEWDRFSFSIRLNDLILMKREEVEGKRLELAVRYSVLGRDLWDNNFGGNYVATFVKVQQEKEPRERGRPSASMTAKKMATMAKAALTFSDDELGDLQNKLKAAASTQAKDLARSPLPNKVPEATSTAAASKPSSGYTVDDFKKGASFAARYDFANSSKNPWRPPVSAPPLHSRTQSFPLPSTTSSSSSPWPQMGSLYSGESHGVGLGLQGGYVPSRKAPAPVMHPVHHHQRQINLDLTSTKPNALLGSPRDIPDDSFRPVPFPVQKDGAFDVPTSPPNGRVRNHQRGYFDLPRDFGSPRRTPSGTPRSPLEITADDYWNPLEITPTPSSVARYNSFPPISTSPISQTEDETEETKVAAEPNVDVNISLPTISTNNLSIIDTGSDSSSEPESASTGLSVTPSSSRSSTPPSPGPPALSGDSNSDVDDKTSHYKELLAKFCFFTGSPENQSPPSDYLGKDTIPRPSSASDIDRLLADSLPPLSNTPHTTLDDLAMVTKTPPRSRSNSGSLTPTPTTSASSSSSDLTLTPSSTIVLA